MNKDVHKIIKLKKKIPWYFNLSQILSVTNFILIIA